MRTTDNNCGHFVVPAECQDDLMQVANKNLIDLQETNSDLLIFPQALGTYNDDIEKSHIFSLSDENKLTTYNLMGFVGRNNTQLTISSRFYSAGNDYFLHYMLQKVFAINIFNFDQTKDNENIWDFLLYLFPYYLKKAYAQGLYKAYRREEYNDANVKGAIDVSRHIRTNIPFSGKIAYVTLEHSYDNPVTQLIRHTIEQIKAHPWGSGILTTDSETRDIVSKICFATRNRYNKNERQKVIYANLKPVSHPYFTEYKILQKICLRILRHEKLTFGAEKDKVYGLLFDGAWLWEEYLNIILKADVIHSENKTGRNAIHLFENGSYKRFPDFYSPNRKLVLDAKYKNLESTSIDRDDMHQLISYMYVLQANEGGFIYPEKTNRESVVEVGKLRGYRGNINLWNLYIPQTKTTFSEFQKEIKQSEENTINTLCPNSNPPSAIS